MLPVHSWQVEHWNRLTHLSMENSHKTDSDDNDDDDDDDGDKFEWQLLQLKKYGIKIYLNITSNQNYLWLLPRLSNKSSNTRNNMHKDTY